LKSNKPLHIYEIRPRKDHRGVNLNSDALPFGQLYAGRMQSAMPSGTRCTAAIHMML